MRFNDFCEDLENKIKASYEDGVTMEQAEKLAGEFLHAQMVISTQLKNTSLDARMRKSGVKAIRASIYLDIVQKSDKKPTEAQIAAMVDSNEIVSGEQKAFDEAEVEAENLERYYSIFQNAHIYFRGIAKGTFNGV